MAGRSIRVVIASTEKGWRGGEQQAALLARGLSDAGLDCQLIAREGSEFQRRLWQQGFEGTTVRGRGKSPTQWLHIRRWLTRFAPDVYYWNDPHAMTSIGVASSGMSGARFVARRTSYRLKSAWPYRLLADRVICVSQAVAMQCIQDGVPAAMTRVVYDGLPPLEQVQARAAKARLALRPDDFVVSCAAALSMEKNQRTLVEAWSKVPTFVNGRRSLLLLAGEGPCREELEQQIDRHQLRDRVCLLGYRDDIEQILAASELFVMPSVREGLCSAGIQAMNGGCRILVANTGGLPELIEGLGESQARVVSDALSSDEWARCVQQMMQTTASSADKESLVSRGRFFSVERMVQQTIAVIEESVDRARQRVA